jgi:glycosyltransferase involved in cell wall biosynthesis
MRVCHIVSGDLWAGAEVMAWNLLKELQKFPDLEISVALLNEGRLARELRTHNLEVRVFDEAKLSFPRLLLAIRAFMQEKSPHVIHSHRYKENILAFLTSGAGNDRARLVATQHGMPEIGHGSSGAAGRLAGSLNRYLLFRRFDRVVGVSRDIRQNFIEQLGFSRDRTIVIHNGIELPDPQPRSRDGAAMVVGSAGRLFAVKDYPLMARIARELAGSRDICFKLAGDGPERVALEQYIREYGLDEAFALKGNVDDMDSFYRELDIYLNTSLHEGIPMAILEAMARGLPVIAPKVGGITEIITDGVEGFLIPTRDPWAFAEKCLLLHRDPILREKMGRAARARVEKDFSATAMAEQHRRLYHELVAG